MQCNVIMPGRLRPIDKNDMKVTRRLVPLHVLTTSSLPAVLVLESITFVEIFWPLFVVAGGQLCS